MGHNFTRADRDQLMLMPVDIREWLDENDIAWTVLDVVTQLDLSVFRARYRANGQGAAAFDPEVMVALVVYAQAVGVRSSRAIERACGRDAGFKVVTGQLVPDHSTITRFLAVHREALTGLFAQVLRLCHEAGMTRVGVIAVDGTKIAANASWAKSYTGAALAHQIRGAEQAYAELAGTLLGEHEATDAAEDAAEGAARADASGDGSDRSGLPPALRGRRARVAALRAAKADLDARQAAAQEQMRAEQAAKQAVWDARSAAGERPRGPRPRDEVVTGPPPSRAVAPRASTTDPDSRRMKAKHGFVQGYNAQIAVTDTQVICGVLLTQTATDHHMLPEVLDATTAALAQAGITHPLATVLADAGYANEKTFTDAEHRHLHLLAPVASDEKRARGQDNAGGRDLSGLPATERAQQRLRTSEGAAQYAQRGRTVEPVFGQLKDRLGLRQFARRGFAAVTAELTLAATVHNLRKLHNWTLAPTTA